MSFTQTMLIPLANIQNDAILYTTLQHNIYDVLPIVEVGNNDRKVIHALSHVVVQAENNYYLSLAWVASR